MDRIQPKVYTTKYAKTRNIINNVFIFISLLEFFPPNEISPKVLRVFVKILKQVLKQAIFLLCISLGTGSHAETSDPLWLQVGKVLAKSKNLVATNVTTDMEMMEGNGKSLGTLHLEEVVSQWKGGEPVRTITAISDAKHLNVAKSRFKVKVDDHPDQAIRAGSSVERLESAKLDGKPCAIFAVAGKTGKRGNIDFKSKVWVEEASGLPLKIIHDFFGIPMVESMKHTIIFGKSTDGNWVPVEATVDGTGSLLFTKTRTISKYKFQKWEIRPEEK